MLKRLFNNYKHHLDYFFNHISLEKTQDILDRLTACKGMLIFSGVGKSGIIADKLAKTMISTGTKALFLPPMNALHGDIGIVTANDILILISKSGESRELLDLIPFAKKRGVQTIAFVSNSQSKLLKACDCGVTLPLEKELCPFDLAPTTSTAIQLIFGDVLAVALMQEKRFSLDDYAENHPAGALGKKISLCVEDLMLKGEDLPLVDKEESLMHALIELTRKRCGCLLVVDQNRKLQGIFTDGDLRRAFQNISKHTPILNKTIGELMTTSFIFTHKHERALNALRLMQRDSKKWVMMLPVMENKRLIGLIRMHDIIQAGMS